MSSTEEVTVTAVVPGQSSPQSAATTLPECEVARFGSPEGGGSFCAAPTVPDMASIPTMVKVAKASEARDLRM
ncbi:hypothetical protein [Alloactinosynnema sp. L-07]|nr:hypothetical protein [Alloactinosynnema sp. L-07]